MSLRRILTFLAALSMATPVMAQEPVPGVTAVDVAGSDTGATVEIRLDGDVPASAVSTFVLTDPDRLLVDILGAGPGAGVAPATGAGPVDRVELSSFDDPSGQVTRASIYLHGPVEHDVQVQDGVVRLVLRPGAATAPDSLAASLAGGGQAAGLDTSRGRSEGPGAPSGPKAIQGPALASLDFVDGDEVARVVIGLSGDVDYSGSEPREGLVVVDLAGARVPQSLRRVLDTSQFVSPVRMVRAYATRGGARVAVNLRRPTEWSLKEGQGGFLNLDFVVPSDMQADRRVARQGFTEAAPSTPQTSGGEGLGGAYASEQLIGAGGRTVNPQAAFGTGRGAGSAASMVGGVAGFSFDSGTAATQHWTGKHINIDLVDADIRSVFRLISHVSRLNIVAGDDVSGKVTVRLVDVPWDQAFSAILQAKGLAAQHFGNIVRVAPIEVVKAEQQSALEARRAQDELTPLQILIVPLNYAQASEVKAQLESQISPRGSVEVDERSNQVIIKETEDRLAKIRELIRQVDRQTPQVLIEARVVESTSRFTRSLGVQWGGEVNASAATGYGTGLFFPSSVGLMGGTDRTSTGTSVLPLYYDSGAENLAVDLGADASYGSLAMQLGSLPGLINLDARLSAMESDGSGEVVSAPRVVTLDNRTATIKQGARVPYLSTSAGGTQVQFITAALTLEVTPHITSDGRIFLKISVENNRPDFSQTVQGEPMIQIKEAETEALVDDGATTVIGGVFATEQGQTIDRVPLLGKLPLVGWLFRRTNTSSSRNEMLVFVTPRVLTEAVKD